MKNAELKMEKQMLLSHYQDLKLREREILHELAVNKHQDNEIFKQRMALVPSDIPQSINQDNELALEKTTEINSYEAIKNKDDSTPIAQSTRMLKELSNSESSDKMDSFDKPQFDITDFEIVTEDDNISKSIQKLDATNTNNDQELDPTEETSLEKINGIIERTNHNKGQLQGIPTRKRQRRAKNVDPKLMSSLSDDEYKKLLNSERVKKCREKKKEGSNEKKRRRRAKNVDPELMDTLDDDEYKKLLINLRVKKFRAKTGGILAMLNSLILDNSHDYLEEDPGATIAARADIRLIWLQDQRPIYIIVTSAL
ncbi:hypothetical protein QAD02_013558 [Eretmocerus hayati]|uniref:Uncharacterized protein n=1 Tax=Eretmocerus hayati TaxID=131215 RepID=A0ACC2P4L4_9HYME|nr:hypothetical protein QAD02_013558 [Eretmocerus hayati]